MSEADKCKSLYSWVDRTPDPKKTATLYVIAIVNAPTPCHEPFAHYIGDKKSNPPIYLLELNFFTRPVACAEVETDRELKYTQPNYSGNHGSVEILFRDGSSKTVRIESIC